VLRMAYAPDFPSFIQGGFYVLVIAIVWSVWSVAIRDEIKWGFFFVLNLVHLFIFMGAYLLRKRSVHPSLLGWDLSAVLLLAAGLVIASWDLFLQLEASKT